MEQIVLKVDEQTAKAWSNMSDTLRIEISKRLEQILIDAINNSKQANFELLLRDVRKEADENGLTEEILTQLLAEKD